MAAGLSYGGWTALSLGGLLADHAAYVDHCAQYGETSSHCNDLIGADVAISDIRAADWNASIDRSGLAGLLPDAQINNIVPAMHSTALSLCKPMAEAILIEEQDDPVW